MLRYQQLIHGLLTIKPGYVDWEMGEFGGGKAKRKGKWEKCRFTQRAQIDSQRTAEGLRFSARFFACIYAVFFA